MKRINNEWWKGSDGYYLQVSQGVYEGPFADMEKEPTVGEDSTVIDAGFITVTPVKGIDTDNE